MNGKSVGLILLLLGLVMMFGAAVLGIGKIKGVVSGFSSIATFASPGHTDLTIEEADTYSLWHDFETFHDGVSVSNSAAIPGGFTFTMRETTSGLEVPFVVGSGSSTISSGSRQASGVGTFEIPSAGTYKLEATNPADDVRVFSVTRGSLLSQFGNVGGVFLYGIVGFIGFILTIPGILLLIFGGKKKSQLPPPAPPR